MADQELNNGTADAAGAEPAAQPSRSALPG
jgi:hypothetical protein